jgi:hypothetical protein
MAVVCNEVARVMKLSLSLFCLGISSLVAAIKMADASHYVQMGHSIRLCSLLQQRDPMVALTLYIEAAAFSASVILSRWLMLIF